METVSGIGSMVILARQTPLVSMAQWTYHAVVAQEWGVVDGNFE